MPTETQERRACIRIPANVEAFYRIAETGHPHARPLLTQNLSMGGALLRQSENLVPGSSLAITLNFPSQGPVVLPGTVIHSKPVSSEQGRFEVGVRWGEMNPIFKSRLNAYLDYRIPIQETASSGPTHSGFKAAQGSAMLWVQLALFALIAFGVIQFIFR